ncbi:hypothetical protein L1987_10005 [Smallanthus sonchifolius]|uniref:Uncharacterized protein n=1 Tax=Smallanthus sonchifolius TaxID=185202 RepID=A0ACB9JR08_9ASTR|nr:hypothetical protein L1987_10005 [Smallanthus sonchifolius]
MGFLMIILMSLFYISFDPKTASVDTLDVTSYGAIGDGDTDDTEMARVPFGWEKEKEKEALSIGSLGRNDAYSKVEQVLVRDCNITGTSNGVRIKTVPYGKGYARSVVFEDINLINVKNPIIIDQHYCTNMENSYCRAPPTASSVNVSDVTHRNIHGSSASKKAIIFNCFSEFNCTEIVTNDVEITGENVYAF